MIAKGDIIVFGDNPKGTYMLVTESSHSWISFVYLDNLPSPFSGYIPNTARVILITDMFRV